MGDHDPREFILNNPVSSVFNPPKCNLALIQVVMKILELKIVVKVYVPAIKQYISKVFNLKISFHGFESGGRA